MSHSAVPLIIYRNWQQRIGGDVYDFGIVKKPSTSVLFIASYYIIILASKINLLWQECWWNLPIMRFPSNHDEVFTVLGISCRTHCVVREGGGGWWGLQYGEEKSLAGTISACGFMVPKRLYLCLNGSAQFRLAQIVDRTRWRLPPVTMSPWCALTSCSESGKQDVAS